MANLKLTSQVSGVLKRATITETSVTLPPENLGAELYGQVKRALVLAGGKWSTPKQAFLFTVDPRGVLNIALSGGTLTDEKKRYQAFYTPLDLAAQIAAMADVRGCDVLEPSAGDGALADACRAEKCSSVYCIELREAAADQLRAKSYLVEEADFLQVPPEPIYDRVVMNPPFTRGHNLKHIAHALKFVRPGGRLVSIMLDGKTDQQLETLCQGHQWDVLPLGPDAFKSAGTSVKTSILTVRVRE